MPSRPAAKRSISTFRYFMPSLRSAKTSEAPEIFCTARSTSPAMRFSSSIE
jgi:hypothetical protein